jgi:hypothetical protein
MKKINNKFLLLFSLTITLLLSCSEQENVIYDNVNGQTLVEFSTSSSTIPVKESEESFTSVTINVSTVSDTNRNIILEVKEASTASSDAYIISPAIILAGEYSTEVKFTGIYDNIPLSGSVDLILKLASIDGGGTIGNDTFTINLERFCPSDLAGEYQYLDGSGKNVTITQISEGNYSISAGNYFTADYSLDINDRCSMITITGGEITNFGIAVSGSGEILPNGNISILYTVDGYFTDRQMTLNKI